MTLLEKNRIPRDKILNLQHLCDELEGASQDEAFEENERTEMRSMAWQLQSIIYLLAAENEVSLEEDPVEEI